ncbi:MAG: hypothetical protein L0Y64_21285 [Myxococcaceae bacterium]|nr:hypothetical protein [Myxococcaceae bacterium]
MKKLFAACVAGSTLMFACGPDTGPEEETGCVDNVCEVTQNVTADTTWTADNTYVLKQYVFVDGATLTIEPGTKVLGERGSALIVQTTGRLVANGEAAKPIVFTSSQEEGKRRAGDWGGVALMGKAKVNVSGGTSTLEGVQGNAERIVFGGTDDAHDCGSLKFVRIEFAGFDLEPGKELNGLTVGACGSQTVLENIHVHRGLDDGIEFFGGTVNLKKAIISNAEDDGLDWDMGWTGKVQFLIVKQEGTLGNNAFECDNLKGATSASPLSQPEIWNATLIGRATGGADKSYGMTLKVGTAGKMNNMIVTGFGDGAVDVADSATAARWGTELFIKNTLFHSNKGAGVTHVANGSPDAANFNEATMVLDPAMQNQALDPQLTGLAENVFQPAPASPARTGEFAVNPPSDGFFDTAAKFNGAVGSDNWATASWVSFPKN